MNVKARRALQDRSWHYQRVEVDEARRLLKDEDFDMLRWLLRYPFSRAEDLACARSIRVSTVYRHLEFQRNLGLVESIIPSILGTKRCALYHLSNLGIHVVATHMSRSVTALAQHCRSDEQSLLDYLPRLAQLARLQDLINGIHALAPEKLGLLGHKARVWWACVRDYRHTFLYRGRSCIVEASGGLVLQVRPRTGQGKNAPDRWYSLFILLDDGLASIDLITARLRGIIFYRESPERWADEQSYYHYFPPVLILTTTVRRQEHWIRKVRELAEGTRTRTLEGAITSAEAMKRSGNQAQFPWHMPWQTLSSDASCHLQDLLEPMPQEAIPPGFLLPHEWQDLDFEDLPKATTPREKGRPIPTVIKGHFAQRAEQIRAEHPSGVDTHEQIALLSLSLTSRLLDLLAFVLDHPMISIQELAALQDVQYASMERYVRELRRLGCLELVDTRRYQQEIRKRAPENVRENLVVKGEIGQRWYLSARGMHILAAAYHFSIYAIALEEKQELAETHVDALALPEKNLIQRAVAGLFRLRHMEHNASVYDFFAQLRLAAERERAGGRVHRLLWWETGVFTQRRYPDHDQMHNLRPDATGAYQVGERTLRFWLEWDCDTMNVKGLQEKFKSYQYYILARRGAYEPLPWLLIVVPKQDQELRIVRIATEALSGITTLTLRITTANLIQQRGPLGEIWLPVLPTRETPRGQQQPPQRCRFFEAELKEVR